MRPYCCLTCGEAIQESSESQGDKNPDWNELLIFHVKPGDNYLEISLKDKTALHRDKIIGSAFLPLFKLYATKYVED